jgi:hypothetical protein
MLRPLSAIYLHWSWPQMYMQALLGPATVGLQMPLVHVTFDSLAVG